MALDVEISVVIATHNRGERLPGLLDSLRCQENAPPFEVVIVDDASTDDTSRVLESLGRSRDVALNVLRQERNTGPAAARNRGWRASVAPAVVFTDDDCLPAPGWLSAMAEALGHADLVQGKTLPDPGKAHLVGFDSHSMRVEGETGFYETCNMGYRRSTLVAVGGFREEFRYPYGEDADLAWRAKQHGARSAFCAGAVVHHDVVRLSLIDRVRHARRLDGAVQLLASHPEFRGRLHRRLWFGASHEAAAVAVVAVIAGSRVTARHRVQGYALIVGGLSWYARVRRRQAAGRGQTVPVVRLPVAFAEDLVQLGAMARSSARHRTLFL